LEKYEIDINSIIDKVKDIFSFELDNITFDRINELIEKNLYEYN